MKKVLGLDLGVGSIGWCLIEKDDHNTPKRILRMGSRIVPISSDEETGYTKGNAVSKNADRTAKPTSLPSNNVHHQATDDSNLSHSCIGQAPPSYSPVRSSLQRYEALSVRS